jgi:hypothetical protein
MQTLYFHIPKCVFEILSVFLKTQIKLGQVSGSYLNPPLLGMTLNKNVLKNIGGEITDGILLNGDAQKIKVITGGEITCPHLGSEKQKH